MSKPATGAESTTVLCKFLGSVRRQRWELDALSRVGHEEPSGPLKALVGFEDPDTTPLITDSADFVALEAASKGAVFTTEQDEAFRAAAMTPKSVVNIISPAGGGKSRVAFGCSGGGWRKCSERTTHVR